MTLPLQYADSIIKEARLAFNTKQYDIAARCYYRVACLLADAKRSGSLVRYYLRLSDKAEATHFVRGKGVVDWKGM